MKKKRKSRRRSCGLMQRFEADIWFCIDAPNIVSISQGILQTPLPPRLLNERAFFKLEPDRQGIKKEATSEIVL